VSDLLDIPYLGPSDGITNLALIGRVEGILFGPAHRPIVSLPVQHGSGPAINVHFLVNPCASTTRLSPAVFKALGYQHVPAAARVKLGGYENITVSLCDQTEHCEHKDVPVLGADFLSRTKCAVSVNYADGTMSISI
jgi:hypothetical protein